MRALLAAALVLAPALASAQVKPKDPPRKQEIIFTQEGTIDGRATSPELGQIDVRPPASFSNLIRIRKDFNDKLRSELLP